MQLPLYYSNSAPLITQIKRMLSRDRYMHELQVSVEKLGYFPFEPCKGYLPPAILNHKPIVFEFRLVSEQTDVCVVFLCHYPTHIYTRDVMCFRELTN